VKRGNEAVDLEMAIPGTEKATSITGDVVYQRLGLKSQPVGANFVTTADRQLRGGLYISEVANGSIGSRAGLAKGDVLIGLHQWETLSLDNAIFVLTHKDLATFSPMKAFFVRDGKVREVPITVE